MSPYTVMHVYGVNVTPYTDVLYSCSDNQDDGQENTICQKNVGKECRCSCRQIFLNALANAGFRVIEQKEEGIFPTLFDSSPNFPPIGSTFALTSCPHLTIIFLFLIKCTQTKIILLQLPRNNDITYGITKFSHKQNDVQHLPHICQPNLLIGSPVFQCCETLD